MRLRSLHITSLMQPAVAALDDAATRAEWSLLAPLLSAQHAQVRVAMLAQQPVGHALVLLHPSDAWQVLWQTTTGASLQQAQALAAWLRHANSALLSDMYVAPGYRRLGIGQALLDDAIECATRAARAVLALQVAADNTAAQGLYARSGFVRSDNPVEDGLWFYLRRLSS